MRQLVAHRHVDSRFTFEPREGLERESRNDFKGFRAEFRIVTRWGTANSTPRWGNRRTLRCRQKSHRYRIRRRHGTSMRMTGCRRCVPQSMAHSPQGRTGRMSTHSDIVAPGMALPSTHKQFTKKMSQSASPFGPSLNRGECGASPDRAAPSPEYDARRLVAAPKKQPDSPHSLTSP